MAKTYTAVPNVSTLQTYASADYNTYTATNISNLIVPPSVCVQRNTNVSYTTGTDITWEAAGWDTDGMWSAGSPTGVTVQTTGLYLITIIGRFQATATLANIYPYVTVDGTSINYQNIPADSSTSAYFFGSITVSLTAGQVVRLKVNMGGGSAYILTGNTVVSDSRSRMILTWIGRTS